MSGPVDALPPAQPAKSRILITLVVDTSSSMSHLGRIDELNAALHGWRRQISAYAHVMRMGEIALVTFGNGHVRVIDPRGKESGAVGQPFVPMTDFDPPRLEAGGVTPMVEGIQQALDILGTRKQQLRSSGIPLANRPLMYLITDGAPTDDQGRLTDRWRDLAPVLRKQEEGRHLLFFALGVREADQEVLRGLAPESAYNLGEMEFSKVLQLVSASTEKVAAGTARNQGASEIYQQVDQHMQMREWLGHHG
ncbi:vWA domain-containing protein [[Actinomadura] parvosata]|uniref:vWA domain-containing protein n=1 Tax=[Actinomadura] parvosata TaxID=1955412 RepID=UPI00406C4923